MRAARELEGDVERTLTLIIRSTRPEDAIGSLKTLTALTSLSLLPLRAAQSVMLTGEEMRCMVEMYTWSGFQYPLLWYSNLTRTPAKQ